MTHLSFTLFWLIAFLPQQVDTVPGRTSVKDTRVQVLIERIKKGDDPNALLEAGRTGDLVFVSYLRERLRQDAYKHESLKWQAQMALAKLGQRDQLQAIYCQVATGNASQVADTMDELEYVGGWFSVRILNGVIFSELATNPALDQHAPPDAQRLEPKTAAAGILAAMFPDGARQIESQQSSSLLSSKSFPFWADYISARQEELKKLQPTGEGLDFSLNACRNGKPRKK